MSHRDRHVHTASAWHAQDLGEVFSWLLRGVNFAAIGLRQGSLFSPRGLALVGLLWVWSDKSTLMERFTRALKIGRRLSESEVSAGVPADVPADVPESISYQAFLKLLVRWSGPLRLVLAAALRGRMQTALAAHFRTGGFCVFGGDGSRLGLPRTLSNEARFSPRRTRTKTGKKRKPSRKSSRKPSRQTAAARRSRARGKKADSPQLWLTTLWHAGSGLPWDWRVGPSDSSERAHLLEMIEGLPADALLTADAGFVGYDFWAALLASGREFLIRVGANVRLLRKLGYARESAGTVYLWPSRALSRQQPPLVLRLVVVSGGRHPWYLVSSVRSQKRLSDRQVAAIYRLRWGIELYYRHFKQTFGRRKLRSHKAEHVEVEAHWSMLGLWALLLHAEAYLHRHRVPPEEVSVAGVLRAYRLAMDEYKSAADPGESLWELLRTARLDGYERTDKSSRAHPRKKYDSPPGVPKIHEATAQQVTTAQQMKQQATGKRLTA